MHSLYGPDTELIPLCTLSLYSKEGAFSTSTLYWRKVIHSEIKELPSHRNSTKMTMGKLNPEPVNLNVCIKSVFSNTVWQHYDVIIQYITTTLYKIINSFPFVINEVMCIETMNRWGYRSGGCLWYWCSPDTIWTLLGSLRYCSSTFFWFGGMKICSCSSHLESVSFFSPQYFKENNNIF